MLLINFYQRLIVNLILFENLQSLLILGKINMRDIDNSFGVLNWAFTFDNISLTIFLLVLDISSLSKFFSKFSDFFSKFFKILGHILIDFDFHLQDLGPFGKH